MTEEKLTSCISSECIAKELYDTATLVLKLRAIQTGEKETFIEWDSLSDVKKSGWYLMADHLLEKFNVTPK